LIYDLTGCFRNDWLWDHIFLALPVSGSLDLAPLLPKICETEPQLQAGVGARRFVPGFKMTEIHRAEAEIKASPFKNAHGHLNC